MATVELLDQAAQVVLATGERGAERLGDVLDLADSAAVEQQRDRGQRLLGGRICTRATAGSATRRAACPRARSSVGGASSMCSEPSRLV